jgi:uncharacterized membrane protein YfcA
VTNPYRAPGAVVADQDRPVGSPVKAVIFGVLTDILGTTVMSVLVVMIYGFYLASSGSDRQEIENAAALLDPLSGIGLLTSALGCVFSFLGGYVCARVAGQAEMKWAAVVAAISLAFGLIIGLQAYSFAMNLLLAAPATAFVLIGGYAGARRNKRP